MKKLMVAMAGCALVAGCASTDKVLTMQPVSIYHVDTSPGEVAFCLANKNNTTPFDRADGSKLVLIKNGYGAVSLAFSIYADGTGSRVEYRKAFGTVGGIWKQCVGAKD